jgi:DMSO/TMAO reductase YedYZ molybdopterin-dependent catalytic subunit
MILDGQLVSKLSSDTDPERRKGLLTLAEGAIGAAVLAFGIAQVASRGEQAPGADQPLPELAGEQPPSPPTADASASQTTGSSGAEVPIGDDGRIVPAAGTRPEQTPDGEFYTVDINATPPEINGDTWRLAIAGMFAETPMLTLADLREYPVHTQPITLSCISNSVGGTAISTAYWSGIRLGDLVADLGLSDEAQYLYIESADGFYETVPLSDVEDPRTLLVYGMNGRSLPVKHGYPMRIYIPDRYGMKQPKWIVRIEATDEDRGGYWTDRGWSKQAIVNATSVIDTVEVEGDNDDYVSVGGIAWAGSRGIQKVEVQVDGGPWAEATLRTPALGQLTWVQWRYEWPKEPGRHTFVVRAVESNGDVQTSQERGTLPNGATGYHSRTITI